MNSIKLDLNTSKKITEKITMCKNQKSKVKNRIETRIHGRF